MPYKALRCPTMGAGDRPFHTGRTRAARGDRAAALRLRQRTAMTNPTRQLHDLGQRLWLDNISRALLAGGLLQRHIDELCITGLTSNPTIFEQAIGDGADYDAAILALAGRGFGGDLLPEVQPVFQIALGKTRAFERTGAFSRVFLITG